MHFKYPKLPDYGINNGGVIVFIKYTTIMRTGFEDLRKMDREALNIENIVFVPKLDL